MAGVDMENLSKVVVVDDQGRLVNQVAWGGRGDGQVEAPCGLALAPGTRVQPDRLFVMDRFGDRVQVFTLAGTCYGAFPALVS